MHGNCGQFVASLTGKKWNRWYLMIWWWICWVFWHRRPCFESSIASRYGSVNIASDPVGLGPLLSLWALILNIIINYHHHYNFYYDCHCYYFHYYHGNRQIEMQPNTRLQWNKFICWKTWQILQKYEIHDTLRYHQKQWDEFRLVVCYENILWESTHQISNQYLY